MSKLCETSLLRQWKKEWRSLLLNGNVYYEETICSTRMCIRISFLGYEIDGKTSNFLYDVYLIEIRNAKCNGNDG